jgi:hypothetical protein
MHRSSFDNVAAYRNPRKGHPACMKVELFAMCDAATDSAGKLNILGVYDTIGSAKVPFVQNRCAIVLKIRFERIERGEHKLKLTIVDQDGKPVVPALEGPLNISFPDSSPSATAQLILDLQNVRFEKFGEFAIDLAVDGRQESSIPLFVKQIQAPQQH